MSALARKLMWLSRELNSPRGAVVGAFIGTALFPRLAYAARWPTRLRGGALVAYVAVTALLGFAIRQSLVKVRRDVATIERLRVQLGREPTDEELANALGLDRPDRS